MGDRPLVVFTPFGIFRQDPLSEESGAAMAGGTLFLPNADVQSETAKKYEKAPDFVRNLGLIILYAVT